MTARTIGGALPLATLALALALPCAATAASLGTIPVEASPPPEPDFGVAGSFDAPGTQTWDLDLERGKVYAIIGDADTMPERVTVRAAGGAPLAVFEPNPEDGAEGATFRAPYAGGYTVEVTDPDPGQQQAAYPHGYTLGAVHDCPGAVSTRCGIAAGNTLHSLWIAYAGDDDWFRTSLRPGLYAATVSIPNSMGGRLLALDGSGRVLADSGWIAGDPPVTIVFRAARAGTYFVELQGDDNAPAPYDLTLARTR